MHAFAVLITHIKKKKIHSSCEIEYFVESHVGKMCVILRSRVLWVVCPHLRISVGDSPCNYSVAIRVNSVMSVSLWAESIKPVSEGDKIQQLWKEMHQFIK